MFTSYRGISILESLTSESIVLRSLCVPNWSLPEGVVVAAAETGVSVGDMDVSTWVAGVWVVGVGVTSDGLLPTQPKADAASMNTSII